MAAFIPRRVFPTLDSLPRSYFLGHHRAGLNKMKTVLSSIDLIIECRDYRVPLSSRNPLFEGSLAGRQRLIVYTKQDLGSEGTLDDKLREQTLARFHAPTPILFSSHKSPQTTHKILSFTRDHPASSLTGSRLMIVGMPNVGKSSLLNALRSAGMHKPKAARTGAQPGITRKISTTVKILPSTDENEGVYLVDTPGVFVPYVPNAEVMLKLALCGSVKDTIIAPATLADYLLYQLNLQRPSLYAEWAAPTNDVMEFLGDVARKSGRLQKGGVPDVDAAALWVIQRWRTGQLGRFVLDGVSEETLERDRIEVEGMTGSLSQARRGAREMRRVRSRAKGVGAG
ncbi:Mitochondrial GTPase [Lambiella insularis]|nr:Mitochondrial GTPase [Lambiella insularis]